MPFIGQQPITGAYSQLDAITASATATYNLLLNGGAYSPASANHLLVSLNGVMQAPQDSFTVSGSTITFASALTSSDNIDFIMALGDVLNIGTPSDGTVTAAKIGSGAVTDAKIAGMAASKLTGALPAIDGSALTNIESVDVSFIVRQASNQTLTRAQMTHITGFTNEDYDVQGVWASDAFTVPSGKAGLYLLYAQVNHQFNSIGNDGEYADVRWYKNGSGLNYNTRMTEMNDSGRHYKEISSQALVLVQLAVGDVLKIYAGAADNNGSGNHTTQSANTYAFGYKVRTV